ncbi:MAG: tyrosine-type recombinase/integrase [Cyanobacteria bacterium J06621_8]
MLKFTSVNDSSSTNNTAPVDPVKLSHQPTDIDRALEEFLGFEVAQGAASPDTIANYTSQSRLFMQWCCDAEVNPLLADKRHIQLYRKYLIDKGYEVSTIELKLQVVRRFYDALMDHRLVSFNPAKNVKPPVNRSVDKIQFLSLEQLQQLLALTEGDTPKLKRDRVILGLMSLHGLRTVEVMNLKYGNLIQREGRYIAHVSSKRAEREVKLREDFTVWLLAHLAGKKLVKSLPIITSLSGNNYGKSISRDGLRRVVNGYLKQIGLRGGEIELSNHALRHTSGTQVYAATKDIVLVQKFLGHSSTRPTSKYVHLVEDTAAADCIEI